MSNQPTPTPTPGAGTSGTPKQAIHAPPRTPIDIDLSLPSWDRSVDITFLNKPKDDDP